MVTGLDLTECVSKRMSLVTFTRCDYWNDKGISSLLDENLAKGIFLDIFGRIGQRKFIS